MYMSEIVFLFYFKRKDNIYDGINGLFLWPFENDRIRCIVVGQIVRSEIRCSVLIHF